MALKLPPPQSDVSRPVKPMHRRGSAARQRGPGAVLETCRSATADGQVFVVRAEGAGVGPRSRPVCRRRPRDLAAWWPPFPAADQPLLLDQPSLGVDPCHEGDGGTVPVPVGPGVASSVASARKPRDLPEDSLGRGASATHGAVLPSRSVTAASGDRGTSQSGRGGWDLPHVGTSVGNALGNEWPVEATSVHKYPHLARTKVLARLDFT